MKRQASLHITSINLSVVLEKLLSDKLPSKTDFTKLANDILVNSKQYSITHRSLLVDKPKLLKSTNKLVLSTRDDAGVFAQLLVVVRRKKRHKGISLIKVGSREWSMVKEVASLAMDFCNDFGLKREEGFKIYIEMGLDKMNNFNLSRFNTVHQSICDNYNAIQTIKEDITPAQTKAIMEIYEKYLGEKTGITIDYTKNPDKYVYFIKAKEEANKARVKLQDYISAQFKGLEWCNSYPEPNQLIGDSAIQRLNKYLAVNKIRVGDNINLAIEAGKKFREKLDNDNNKHK
jgi:hypothetical protein